MSIYIMDVVERSSDYTFVFRYENSLVYSQIAKPENTSLSQQELAQRAYENCKKSLDYEKLSYEPSLKNKYDHEGELFVPEKSHIVSIDIYGKQFLTSGISEAFSDYEIILTDNYGEKIHRDIEWQIESGNSDIRMDNGRLFYNLTLRNEEVKVRAICEGMEATLTVYILPPQITEPLIKDYIEMYGEEKFNQMKSEYELISR